MTWTVGSGDQETFSYQIHNKKMTVWFSLKETSVGGTPNTDLLIALPASKDRGGEGPGHVQPTPTAAERMAVGQLEVTSGSGTLRLLKAGFANWTAATNTTAVWGQIEIPIN